MQNIRRIIGEKIKFKRRQMRMTQYELAERVGVDPKYISRIETGSSYSSLSVIERIFDVLDINFKTQLEPDFGQDKNEMVATINTKLKKTTLNNVCIIKNIIELLTEQNEKE